MTNDFDLKAVRKNLFAMGRKHAGNVAVTTRVFTLIEQLQEYEAAPPDQRKMLEKLITQSVAELGSLTVTKDSTA